jgi:hypothetical protein
LFDIVRNLLARHRSDKDTSNEIANRGSIAIFGRHKDAELTLTFVNGKP